MNLKSKKTMAAKALKVSRKKVKFDTGSLEDIKEAITLRDIVSLIKRKLISKKKIPGKSRGKIREKLAQKKKGRSKGMGKRKGTAKARNNGTKESWMKKIRTQRIYIKNLKSNDEISSETYRMLYRRCKGGYFRSKRHINLYLTEKGLVNKK